MIDPLVRHSRRDDLAHIAWLESLARAALVGTRGGDRWLETHPPHGGGAGRSGSVWVATIDEVVIGYLVLHHDAEVARVADVFVHPEARQLGFGDALLSAAVTEARDRGARLLEAEALPGDRETKNLYERAGITARMIIVSTPL